MKIDEALRKLKILTKMFVAEEISEEAKKSIELIEKELQVLDILKDKFVIKVEKYDWKPTCYDISFCGKKDYDINGGIDVTASEFISKEEYDLLKEVLNNADN